MNDSSSFMKRWIRLFILQLRRNLYVSATIATLLCSYLALNQVSLPVQRCAAVKVTSKLRTRLTGLVRRPKGFQTESSPQEATPDNEAEISFCQLNQLARYWTGQYSSAVEDCWFTNARRAQDSLGASIAMVSGWQRLRRWHCAHEKRLTMSKTILPSISLFRFGFNIAIADGISVTLLILVLVV